MDTIRRTVTLTPTTVLPAVREDVEFTTEDGLRLVGELAMPLDRDPVATLVTLHPLSTHGGFMDSHVLRKASYRLPEMVGAAVLRFNLRGVTSPRGASEGTFDHGVGEAFDVRAAVAFARARGLPAIRLLGWSFGTDLALMHGLVEGVEGAVLLSPPLRHAGPEHLRRWDASGLPLLALVPELDDYLRLPEATARFAAIRQARVVGVPEAKHLWVGEPYVRIALDHIAGEIVPGSAPLPTSWPVDVSPDDATGGPGRG